MAKPPVKNTKKDSNLTKEQNRVRIALAMEKDRKLGEKALREFRKSTRVNRDRLRIPFTI